MLHTVNKSPFSSTLLDQCLRFAKDGDPILLIEDGVYAALAGTDKEGQIRDTMKTNPLYALSADIKARGIERVIDGIRMIDYNGFVDLCVDHKVNNWL
jgi:tRNA 2-thiouridine synthesizing protein B